MTVTHHDASSAPTTPVPSRYAAPAPGTQPGAATHDPFRYPTPDEFSTAGTPSGDKSAKSSGGGVRTAITAFVAAVAASAITLAAAFGFGAFDSAESGTGESTATVVASNGEATDVVAVAQAVRPAIVAVKVAGQQGQGSGSGVIYSSGGLVLTNNHVVQGANQVEIELEDGRTIGAEVVGTDPSTDIAVLQADSGGLPTAELGTAKDLQIGEVAVAIGNPLGLEGGPTVTSGVISALGRDVQGGQGQATLVDMIQTDAPIAPGSSGGALVDGNGRIIGITTAIAVAPNVGSTDIGYAVPIDIAKKVAGDIVEHGEAQHAYLGIRGADALADSGTEGARIVSVEPGGPAAKAGLEASDIVVGVDGEPVASMTSLVLALRTQAPGDSVTLDVIRNGQTQSVDVTLVARPNTN